MARCYAFTSLSKRLFAPKLDCAVRSQCDRGRTAQKTCDFPLLCTKHFCGVQKYVCVLIQCNTYCNTISDQIFKCSKQKFPYKGQIVWRGLDLTETSQLNFRKVNQAKLNNVQASAKSVSNPVSARASNFGFAGKGNCVTECFQRQKSRAQNKQEPESFSYILHNYM